MSSVQRFLPSNEPTAPNGEICLIFAQQPKNHFTLLEQYFSTSFLETYPLEYSSESSIILPSICNLAHIIIPSFIRRLVRAKRKVVPWHSHPVAIFSTTLRNLQICTGTPNITAPLGELSSDSEASSHPTRIVRQTVIKAHCEHCALVMTIASGIYINERSYFERSRQMTLEIRYFTIATALHPCNQLFRECDGRT